MVLIRELEHRVVAVQIGHWERDAIGKWRFEQDPNERQRNMRLREGDGIDTITTMLKQEYNISDVKTRLKLTFRWPSWMLLVDDGTTRPQTIKTDNDMDLFLSMKVDVADLILFVTRKNDAGVVTESPTLSNSAGSSSQPQSATLIHEDYVVVELPSSDSDDDSGDSRRPDPWNERLDGLMSKKISNLEVGSASTVPTYADEENTFFGVNLSMGVFGRDAAPVLDNNIDGGNTVVDQAIDDATYEGDDIFVGRVYKNKEDFKFKMAIHALQRKFHFRHTRSDKKVVLLNCVADSCPWRVYVVRLEDSDNYQVRSACLEHTCSVEARSNYHKQASARVVGEFMRPQYMGAGTGPTPGDGIAMDGARGSMGNSYSLLPAYLHALKAANPGTLTALETTVDELGNQRFKYLFFALAASINGLKFMRKVIVIDGAHLRGNYGGCVITARAQDGNFQIFPVAFGIVDSENDRAWEWFLTMLRQILPNDPTVTFVSDRHSSIYSSLRKVFPNAAHAACVVHLQRNISSIFKAKTLSFLVSRAAQAYRITDFHLVFGEICRVSPECGAYLNSIGFGHWARSYFVGERYNVMTSNVAESLNAVLKEAQEFPIVYIVEFVRKTLMSWFAIRRETAKQEATMLTPKVREILQENFEKSGGFAVRKVNTGEYDVVGGAKGGYHVQLALRSCTCREFNFLKIPCPHAVAAAIVDQVPMHSLVDVHYTSCYWVMAYKDSINPVPALSSLHELPEDIASMNLLPPHTKRAPGRPKKKRFFSRGEFQVRATSLATFSYTNMYPIHRYKARYILMYPSIFFRRKGCEDRMFAQDARLRGTTGPLAACPYSKSHRASTYSEKFILNTLYPDMDVVNPVL
ncbi:Zinc finger SWIM-type [Arabidopsis thaliana x Arabidopsis arenosa]|uniref:Zinc finger SWIM-type n=1 Tax=Arabidopsis thaliana x Arabidopsis arenosa TaxID=1240361 RepID=A0A8T2C7U0_9BRAS|nr:Zinc finger SWIM-type [Arabidopsis thaliana x Arabidopsis arenosa]